MITSWVAAALGHAVVVACLLLVLLTIVLLALSISARVLRNGGTDSKHVVVLVLGDVGRSPRMQYHCLSLAELPADVSLVGYPGESCFPLVTSNPRIRQYFIAPPTFANKLPRAVGMPCKVVLQVAQLFLTLLWTLRQPDVLLLQNPPCIPTLIVALIAGIVRNCRVVVDWHNFGYTVLAMRFASGENHPVVRFAKIYERVLGGFCSGGLCVTKAMQRHLKDHWGIEVSVLYDRPPHFFRRQTTEEARELFSRLAVEYADFKPMLDENPPALVVSSTSWTADEDFSILLSAIEALDAQAGSPLLFVITGKGPEKAYYERRIAAMTMTRCRVITVWLAAEDYPRLLGSATLGVSLHTSTSGLDLPMKVVDMFGAGLPVCAVGFDCLDELVVHGKNGLVFRTPDELATQMRGLLEGWPREGEELRTLRQGVREWQALRWQDNWQASAAKFFS